MQDGRAERRGDTGGKKRRLTGLFVLLLAFLALLRDPTDVAVSLDIESRILPAWSSGSVFASTGIRAQLFTTPSSLVHPVLSP